jgi:hypothetical protein
VPLQYANGPNLSGTLEKLDIGQSRKLNINVATCWLKMGRRAGFLSVIYCERLSRVPLSRHGMGKLPLRLKRSKIMTDLQRDLPWRKVLV